MQSENSTEESIDISIKLKVVNDRTKRTKEPTHYRFAVIVGNRRYRTSAVAAYAWNVFHHLFGTFGKDSIIILDDLLSSL